MRVVSFGFRTHFGGGRLTGFALIYEDETAQRRLEPAYRLLRAGMVEKKVQINGMLRRERKNREKKYRGTLKPKASETVKKE